jgi:hypothetical protein
MMEAAGSSKTLLPAYEIKCNIPLDYQLGKMKL